MLKLPTCICFVHLAGVEIKLKNMHYKTLIAPTHIPELNKISKEDDGICFGGSVTLSMIEETLQESINEKQGTCTCIPLIHSSIIQLLDLRLV